jgi:acetylornithine deacetylase
VKILAREEIKKAIFKAVDESRDEIVAFLQKLISFPSVTGEEKGIQEFIAGKLSEIGLEVDIWEPDWEELKKHPGYIQVDRGYEGRPNVVGKFRGGGGKSLLFNGHVDVIPADPSAWKHDPWLGEIEGDRLYGRGASDMKSGLAAMTMSLNCLLEAGIRPKGEIILEYVVDEERSGHGTLACVLRGYKADAGICCETSDLNVQPACIGRIWFEISVSGKPAGIARRWEGVDAIEKGYKIAQAVLDLEKIRINELRHPLYPDNRGALPCSIGVFEAGSFPSALADRCLLKGSMATLPGEDSEAAKKQLVEQVQNVAKTDPWLRYHPPEVRFTGYFAEPAEIPADHPICKTLAAAFREVTGKNPTISGREGAADTRFLVKYGQTPTVIFGPGRTAQMHATDEWVSIEDVVTAVKTLALTIVDWCG